VLGDKKKSTDEYPYTHVLRIAIPLDGINLLLADANGALFFR
jgi:hypothetical protein